jgi:tRNA(Ile)-lysidine synthase
MTSAKNENRVKRLRPVRSSRVRLSKFALHLFEAWAKLEQPTTDSRVVIAVSGGADSTALLLAFDELIKAERLALDVVVAHLDHGLRKKTGKEDAQWVKELTRVLGHKVELGKANVGRRAKNTADNLEQAARLARYAFLARVAKRNKAQVVLTAHTMNDQAETVLLRLLRGSGADGLSGIAPVRSLDSKSDLLLVRPLITWAKRTDTESHCRHQGVEFRQDEMNHDERFARVRVRQTLVPLLQSFNGKVIESLTRTADLLREDIGVLNEKAATLLQQAESRAPENKSGTSAPLLNVEVLARAPAALRRRALRQWIAAQRGDLRGLEMVHLLAVEKLLGGNRGGRVAELPGGASVLRQRGQLKLRTGKG